MNSFKAIEVSYLSSSKTIETVLVSNLEISKIFYVYNYEGYSFRIFETILSIINFFSGENEGHIHLNSDFEVDKFFYKVALKK